MTGTQYTPAEIVTKAQGLLEDTTAADDRVHPWRMVPFQDDELPAISIFITRSTLAPTSNETNLIRRRTDTLSVQAHTIATYGDESAPQAHTIIEECLRRLITDMDIRKEFHRPQAVSFDLSPDNETDAARVVATLTMDMIQDYQFQDVRTGDAFTTLHSTMDIDETGDAPDVEAEVTLTGGTP